MSQLATQIDALLRPRCQRGSSLRLSDANCWARDLLPSLSCAPRGSTNGMAISPSCMILAAHFASNGTAVRTFIDRDGVPHSRTDAGYMPTQMLMASGRPDMGVMRLNAPLPETVRMPRILPPDWRSIIPDNGAGLYAVTIDAEDKAIIHQVQTLDNGSGKFVLLKPTDPTMAAFWEQAIVGDSSSPAFLILPNQVVAIGCVSWAGTGNCSGLAAERVYWQIVTAMQRLGDLYQPRCAIIENLQTPLDGYPLIGSPSPSGPTPYPTLPASGNAYYLAKHGLNNGDVTDAAGAVFGGPLDVTLLGDALVFGGNQELTCRTYRRCHAANDIDATVLAVVTVPGGTPKENYLCRIDGSTGNITIKLDSANGLSAFAQIGNEQVQFTPVRGKRMLVMARRVGASMMVQVDTQTRSRANCINKWDSKLTWPCAIFGGTGGHTANFLNGMVEQFAVWPRGLSDAEISAVRASWKI